MRLKARPRMNTHEETLSEDSWYKRAVMLTRDLPPKPEGEHTRCHVKRCALCHRIMVWEQKILDAVSEATGWALFGTPQASYSPTGRPFCSEPMVYIHKNHPKALIVAWSGGLDV